VLSADIAQDSLRFARNVSKAMCDIRDTMIASGLNKK
jgi:hypothetical protein